MSNITNEDRIETGEEVAYVFLKDALVNIITLKRITEEEEKHQMSTISDSINWTQVTYRPLSQDELNETNSKKRKLEHEACVGNHGFQVSSSLNSQSMSLCPRCNLILYETNQHENELTFQPSHDTSFNGAMEDAKICSHHNHDDDGNRSDAALILGLVETCKRQGLLRVESFQLLISPNMDGNRLQCEQMPEYNLRQVQASIVITISLPYLEKRSQEIEPLTEMANYDDYLSSSGSFCSSYAQLLFSIMRSDWSWLDRTMKTLLSRNRERSMNIPSVQHHNKKEETSVFPPELSLQALYDRIQGASSQEVATSFNTTNVDKNHLVPAGELTLPEEILQNKIAPFIRAKSLQSLRTCCKYLYNSLRAVVPGMKLQLFPHQIKSLTWMRSRESKQESELNAMISGADNPNICDILEGDLFQSVSAGSIISVTPRRSNQTNRPLWHINTWSGQCSQVYKNELIRTVSSCRNIARGGLLCDDPGLGKTITVLSLILQTHGLSTESNESNARNLNESTIVSDDIIIDSYWREVLVESTRNYDLRGIALQLRKRDHGQYFQSNVMDVLTPDEQNLYLKIVENPICMNDVLLKIDEGAYSSSVFSFYEDVRRIYTNAKKFNAPTHYIHQMADYLLNELEVLFAVFKQSQLQAAIAAGKRTRSNLGTLISEKKRMDLHDNLISSSATLLVVPHTLLKHWEEQIKLHVDFSACSYKRPLIFHHRSNSSVRRFRNRNSMFQEVSDIESTHDDNFYHAVFLDESSDELPDAKFLSKFLIVITTTKRLTNEWKHGSFEEQLRKEKNMSSSKSYRSFNYDVFDQYSDSSPSSLLKVHWLRLIVDEGHSMGKKGSPTNSIDVAGWITAERRFAMTGTPTPQTVSNTGLGNLFGLMKFLKHDYFCAPHYGEERYKLLDRGFKYGDVATFFKIRQLLNLFMVRHTKKDIEQLHKPIFTRTYTDMSNSETLAYNTLVSAVQSNLIATAMEGKTSGKQDSLLNSRQSKHAQQALSNIRLACCGGTDVVPTLNEKHWNETIELMYNKHNHRDYKINHVQNFLKRMTSKELSICMCCGLALQSLLLLPCACLFCTECITSKTKTCPGCNEEFDIDDFQKLQPGIVYEWNWNINQSKKEREERHFTELEIHSVLNRQSQHGSVNAADDTSETRGPMPRRRRLRKNDAHICVYPDIYLDGRCKICGEIHMCNFMNTQNQSKCPECHCISENCPKDESKAFYIEKKLLDLWNAYSHRIIDGTSDSSLRPFKVLLFSQFNQILNVIGDRLIRRFGTGCISEYWGRTRDQELDRFAKHNDCFCMLLGKDGSHGLNLQFVTHIFFLDEILDKSLESQVVSRAYRMGASEHVFVEQLVSRNTIEELIVQLNKRDKHVEYIYANDPNACTLESKYYSGVTDNEFNNDQKHKVRQLLSNVKLIRPLWANINATSKRSDQDLTEVSTNASIDDSKTNVDDCRSRTRQVKFFST
jgi:SNF2 family DNA or RNA helicase